MKSHLQSYPCPLQINFFWNLGFLLGGAIMFQIFFLIREVYYGRCLRYFHSSGASFVFFFSISTSWKSYVLWFILLFIFYLVFRNSSSLLLNGYSIYGLCLTFWTNEFLGSYSNYKFIISFSIFSRMGFWG